MEVGASGPVCRLLVGVLVLILTADAAGGDAPGSPLPPPRVVRRTGTQQPPAPPGIRLPAAPPEPAPEGPTPAPAQPRGAALPPPRVRRVAGGPAAVAATTAPGASALPDAEAPSGPEDRPAPPSAPPPRPRDRVSARPEDLVFEVDREGGTLRPFPDGSDRIVLVMAGNPRIRGFAHTRADGQRVDDLEIKANTVVAWIDVRRLGAAGLLAGIQGGSGSERLPAPPGDPPRDDASVLQEAVLGLYAEGAVELVYGDLAFRAERLYLEPPTYQALLIEPRFTGRADPTPPAPEEASPYAPVDARSRDDARRARREAAQRRAGTQAPSEPPLYVRAREARLVGQGVAVFDDAEVSLSRADDRIALQVARLVIEEEPEEAASAAEGGFGRVPSLLGFRSVANQRYQARGTQLRGERIPLAYWGDAAFAYPLSANLPIRIKDFTYGNRSSQGRYANLTLGGRVGPAQDPWFDWGILGGGYWKRGPAGGAELQWDRPRWRGQARGWAIYETGGKDQTGYVPDHPTVRWLGELESRADLSRRLQFDLEWNDFSDGSVNREYFENDALTHKDRESYGRLRWQDGLVAATLTGKWHARDFVSETTQLPEAALWSSALPLLVPRRKGAPGVDLVTRTQAGYLRRTVADGLPQVDYGATRLQTVTTANLGFDAGDVRVVGFAGLDGKAYLGRTDEEEDQTFAMLVAGARANLQLHRTWEARGGPFQLERLRHVVDLDVGGGGRYLGEVDPLAVPIFDETDVERDQTELAIRARNRLQTRGRSGAIRDVLDLETGYTWYLDDRAPYLQSSPGVVDVYLRSRPRERLYVAGEADYDLGIGAIRKGYAGAGVRWSEDLVVATGIRYVRSESVSPAVDLSWRWSEKYGVRLRESYDFQADENRLRLIFGRYSPDHAFFFGVSQRGDDVAAQFNFQTTVGRGGIEADRTFNDEPDPDPWGVFP